LARIPGIDSDRKPIDLASLRALTDAMPFQHEPTRSWLRSVRDGSRY
jgi:hypothetical protein